MNPERWRFFGKIRENPWLALEFEFPSLKPKAQTKCPTMRSPETPAFEGPCPAPTAARGQVNFLSASFRPCARLQPLPATVAVRLLFGAALRADPSWVSQAAASLRALYGVRDEAETSQEYRPRDQESVAQMVRMPLQNSERPIHLLEQHYTRQFMRDGHLAQRQHKIGMAAKLF